MGLDIYKMKPVKHKTDFSLSNDEDMINRYRKQVFEVFKSFIVKEQQEFILWDKTFANKKPDLSFDDYELNMISGQEYTFIHKDKSKDELIIEESELVTEMREVEVIYFEDEDYQRNNMGRDFYDKFIQPCWYVSNDSGLSEEESNDIILSAEKFKEFQSYAESAAKVKGWDFVEGQHIIYLSY